MGSTPPLIISLGIKGENMPKDILDIVDTAIKIGLGAAIGGLTTYTITNRQIDHEKTTDEIKFKREQLVYISERFEKSQEVISKIAIEVRNFLYYQNPVKVFDVKSICCLITDALHLIGLAKASSNLLGFNKLFETFSSLDSTLSDMIDLIERMIDDKEAQEQLKDEWEKVLEIQESIYPTISEAFQKMNV